MIQCRSHGITNRTLTGVLRMIPAEEWMRALGTVRRGGGAGGGPVPRAAPRAVQERAPPGDRGPLGPGREPQRAPPGELAVPGQPPGQAQGKAERVVGADPRAYVGTFPDMV